METRYIEEYLVLADCLNFSEAARELNMAQSTLSKHMQALERETDGVLFDRSARQIRLTPLGECFLPGARRIAEAQRETAAQLETFKKNSRAAFTLAAVNNMQYFNIDRYMIGFYSVHPECTINVVEGEESELLAMFQSGQTNFYTAYYFTGETPDCVFLPVAEGHIVALLPEGHPLGGRNSISLTELAGEKLLLPGRNTKMFRAVMSTFSAAGIAPHIVYTGNSIGCLDLVRSGMGISLQPRELAVWRPEPGICRVDLDPAISYRYGLGCRELQSLTVSERKLLAYLRELSDREGFQPEC